MQRDTKLGYGFLLVGAPLLYIVEKLWGPIVALIFALVILLLGVGFLVSAHSHRESETPPRRRGLMTLIALYATIGAASGTLLGGVFGAIRGLLEMPIKPTIAWAVNSPIKFGTAIENSQLQAKASAKGKEVEGDYVYNHEVGDVLQVGKHPLSVNFSPINTRKYESVSKIVFLVVEPATPPTPQQTVDTPPQQKAQGSAPPKSAVVRLVPETLTGGHEPGDIVTVGYAINNESDSVISLGGNFLYRIGPTIYDPELEANKENEFWQTMQNDYKPKTTFVDFPGGGIPKHCTLKSYPLTEDQSMHLKDGSYTMFFLMSYTEEHSKKVIAGSCGIVSLKSNFAFQSCYRHNFP
jgi:hypothetical protein